MPLRIAEPLQLPCGATLSNRIAKAALSEQLAGSRGMPGEPLERLYRTWSEGGAALLLTGNIMVDPTHLESGRNVTVERGRDVEPYRRWARAGTHAGNHLWLQINHPGRQTPRFIEPHPLAPSEGAAVKLFRAYGEPRAVREDEIPGLVARYADAASIAKDAGFTGVQIHGAHGYLVNQFLSPRTNRRTDRWGGSLENRARFLLEVFRAMRDRVGPAFPIGVKLNSKDFQQGGFDEDDAIVVAGMLATEGCDLLEISGGNYETPMFFDLAERSKQREAYFLEFARTLRARVRIPLMVTGGFRTLAVMEAALAEGALDVIGLGRPLALEPDLPRRMIAGQSEGSVSVPRRFGVGNPNLEYFAEGGYYLAQMGRMASGRPPDPGFGAFRAMGVFVAQQVEDSLRYRRMRRQRTPG